MQLLPRIGITTDICDKGGRCRVSRHYSRLVTACGGVPILLAPHHELAGQYLELCHGLIFTGGDDPIMEAFNQPTHPQARPVHPDRQRFELRLLQLLDDRPDVPVLGVCLGMQYMALHAGGALNQYLPDSLPSATEHWDHRQHAIHGRLGDGFVHSHHRQAISDPGSMCIMATAHDGVIEAVMDDRRGFYLGVQWHPERTDDDRFGRRLFRWLVDASRGEFGDPFTMQETTHMPVPAPDTSHHRLPAQ